MSVSHTYVRKRSGMPYRQISVKLALPLAEALDQYCNEHKMNISDVIRMALEGFLSGQGGMQVFKEKGQISRRGFAPRR